MLELFLFLFYSAAEDFRSCTGLQSLPKLAQKAGRFAVLRSMGSDSTVRAVLHGAWWLTESRNQHRRRVGSPLVAVVGSDLC